MQEDNLTLSKALPSQAQQVSALIKEAMLTYSKESGISPDLLESMRESVESVAFRIKNNTCLCLFEGDLPVATITLHVSDNPMKYSFSLDTQKYLEQHSTVVYISRFAVSDRFRGTGLGLKLLQAAIDFAKANGADVLLLHTARSNEVMTTFYQNRGFEILDIETSRSYPRALFAMKL